MEVYQLFNEELNLVKKEFNTKTVDLPPMYPIYAGSAAWARMLKRRIDRPMNVSSLSPTWSFCFIWGGLINGWDSSSSRINCVKISNFLAKIFGFLAKIFKDEIIRSLQLRTLLKRVVVNRTWKKIQARTAFLPRSLRIFKILVKIFKDIQRSWKENERSLKILAGKWKILEDSGKKMKDPGIS